MKVFVVLGVCLLAACTEAGPGRRYGGMDPILHPCASFKEFVQNLMGTNGTVFDQYPVELKVLALKIKSFTAAASMCIPNNRTYRNTHAALDNILSIIVKYPTETEVSKSIANTQDYMDERFDDLQASSMGVDLSEDLRNAIDEFVKLTVQKAVKVFHKHEGVSSHLEQDVIPIATLLGISMDRLVEKVDSCLKIAPSAYESMFDHRRRIRMATRHLQHGSSQLASIAKEKFQLWSKLIDELVKSFDVEFNQLQLRISGEKNPKQNEIEHDNVEE